MKPADHSGGQVSRMTGTAVCWVRCAGPALLHPFIHLRTMSGAPVCPSHPQTCVRSHRASPVRPRGPRGRNLPSPARAPHAHLSGPRTQRARQTRTRKCPAEQRPSGCAGAPRLLPGLLSEASRLGGPTAERSPICTWEPQAALAAEGERAGDHTCVPGRRESVLQAQAWCPRGMGHSPSPHSEASTVSGQRKREGEGPVTQ